MKKTKISRKKAAFTLAETLIAIGIIGVVAALTIPTVMTKIRAIVFEKQFKTAYANVQQAIRFAKSDLGVDTFKIYCAAYSGSYHNASACSDAFMNAFNSKRTLTRDASLISNFNKTKVLNTANGGGVLASLFTVNENLDGIYVGFSICEAQVSISFDINGPNGPNRLGFDIFNFRLNDKDELVTQSVSDSKTINYTQEKIDSYCKSLEGHPSQSYYCNTYGLPCSYDTTQTFNGIGCGYYAARNKCPDGSGRKYFECLPK